MKSSIKKALSPQFKICCGAFEKVVLTDREKSTCEIYETDGQNCTSADKIST